jgi:hypothetical protein
MLPFSTLNSQHLNLSTPLLHLLHNAKCNALQNTKTPKHLYPTFIIFNTSALQ